MDKKKLEQEAERTDRHSTGRATGRTESEPRGPSGRPVAGPAVRHAEIHEEKVLVQLMTSDAAWRARARRELEASDFRHPVYRAIAEAVLGGAEGPPDDELAPTWEELAQPFGPGFDAEAAFAGAASWVKERRRIERLDEIDRLAVLADEGEKQKLVEEKETLVAALRASGHLTYRRRVFKTEREPT
jgi:hypothetical protein